MDCRFAFRTGGRHRVRTSAYRSRTGEQVSPSPACSRLVPRRMEHFMPYLASKGFESYAVSLRGQGSSDKPTDGKGSSLAEHARDIADLLRAMAIAPILVGHSFGGLLVQRFFLGAKDSSKPGEPPGNEPPIAGMALLCSASPDGNKGVVDRLFKRSPWAAIQMTWSFIFKNFLTNASVCRRMFFSSDLPEEKMQKYQELLRQHASPVPVVNVWTMRQEVPLPVAKPGLPPVLVLGAKDDLILDMDAVQATALHYGVQPVVLQDMAHDCMLDTRWQQAADQLVQWGSSLSRAT